MVSFRRKKKTVKETAEAKEKAKTTKQEQQKKKSKKKLKEEATTTTSEQDKQNVTPPKQRKKKTRGPPKATAVLPRSVSKEYTPPLTTITESQDEDQSASAAAALQTPAMTEEEESVLQQVNVVTSGEESMEVMIGSASSQQTTQQDLNDHTSSSEPTVLLEQVRVFDKQESKHSDTEVLIASDKDMEHRHDDIRKALFQEEETLKKVESIETDEEDIEEDAIVAEDVDLQPTTTTNMATTTSAVVTPEQPPFDEEEEYGGEEDPAILDLLPTPQTKSTAIAPTSSEGSHNSLTAEQQQHLVAPTATIEEGVPSPQSLFNSDIRDASMTKKLLAALNCNFDTTDDSKCGTMSTFYDTMCTEVKGKRPFFSEEFTRDFLEDAVNDGIPLMFHFEQEPEGGPGAPPEWKGKSVTMFVRQGNYQGSQIIQPRLEWPTPEQQWTTEVPGTVNLLDIQSISDSSQDDVRDDIEVDTTEVMDLCFFSITTKDGEVYMFESASPAERDWIVTGLKNVIVRLSYHLTVGDPAVSSELFGAEYEYGSGDLPTLKTPVQAMNEVAHAFLD